VRRVHPGGVVSSDTGILSYKIKDGRFVVGIKREPSKYIEYLFSSD